MGHCATTRYNLSQLTTIYKVIQYRGLSFVGSCGVLGWLVSVGLIIRLSGFRVPVGPPFKSRGCSNSASSNSAILPQRLHRDYKTPLLTNLIGQGRPYLTPPRGSYLVLRYCNCSCTDLRRAVLEKWEARQRAERLLESSGGIKRL